tara:strand:+ start:13140 stop:13469 length:330 start_codon:yes stop_codon:yes gene_type:complete
MGGGKHGLRKISQYTGRPIDTALIIGSIAVGTIAAFAWRDLTDELFERYFPKEGSAVRQRLIYAIIVTVIAIILILIMSKISNFDDDRRTDTSSSSDKKIGKAFLSNLD